ncbi:class I SAM-dependent methyltransferase [Krasilnikovia sp. M28-CT-15]|uniref:class I SAM-dependent methyltransferase n=1 Tax=Krasilnikovia sp. M28-CT-15 TaxID=3373540 RepID=UPI00399CB58A
MPIEPVLQPLPFVPEISLFLVAADVGLFDLTGGEFRSEEPPPFWAFAWAGGQALARHVLDHPEIVRGRRVLDLASGSGLVAIAAARAGAAEVRAVDVDPAARAAVARNAAANGVHVRAILGDAAESLGSGVHGDSTHDAADPGAGTSHRGSGAGHRGSGAGAGPADAGGPEVVLAGDAFYSPAVGPPMARALHRAARSGVRVLVGDPGRGFLPKHLFTRIAEYAVPVPESLEETELLVTGIWEIRTT